MFGIDFGKGICYSVSNAGCNGLKKPGFEPGPPDGWYGRDVDKWVVGGTLPLQIE